MEISQESDLQQDFSNANIVRIKHCVKSFDWIDALIQKELSEFLRNNKEKFNKFSFGGFENIDLEFYHNEVNVVRHKTPLVKEFLKDGFYHFPLKELRKILTKKKKEAKKDEQNENASAFAFDIFSSVIMEEMRCLGFQNVEKEKTTWSNEIKAESQNVEIKIMEVKLKQAKKKQQEMDDSFPLEISIIGKHGRSGDIWFRSTWGAIKKLLPGLKEI